MALLLLGALEGRDRGCGVGVRVVLDLSHLDVVFEIEVRLGVVVLGLEINDQVVLHSEDGVNIEMGVIAGVDLIDDGGVVGVGDLQMDMGGTHGGSVHEVEEHAGRAVGGEGVRSGMVAVPPELSLLI